MSEPCYLSNGPVLVERHELLRQVSLPPTHPATGVAELTASCSPACSTCYGPSASQCLTCSPPRMNLDGQCVGVDGRGVCDTTLAGVQGVFVASNDTGRCDGEPLCSMLPRPG